LIEQTTQIHNSFCAYTLLLGINIVLHSHSFAGIRGISCARKAVRHKLFAQAKKCAVEAENHIAIDTKLTRLN